MKILNGCHENNWLQRFFFVVVFFVVVFFACNIKFGKGLLVCIIRSGVVVFYLRLGMSGCDTTQGQLSLCEWTDTTLNTEYCCIRL